MPLTFNMVLGDAAIALDTVRLLRHQDQRAEKGRTPYELWRDDRQHFELYQSHQSIRNRPYLNASYWASFVGTPDGGTLFVGVYQVKYQGLLSEDTRWPHADGMDKAGSCDIYALKLDKRFNDISGKLFVDWGDGKRRWIQRADKQNKRITELRTEYKEDTFPGFMNFVERLSRIEKLPRGWQAALKSSRGIYLLTCPRTREQYVGKAAGGDGFWGRWQCYVQTGHGGNEGLKSRDPSDYQVAILEVAGTAMGDEEISAMEERWKRKLQSKKMGLNK